MDAHGYYYNENPMFYDANLNYVVPGPYYPQAFSHEEYMYRLALERQWDGRNRGQRGRGRGRGHGRGSRDQPPSEYSGNRDTAGYAYGYGGYDYEYYGDTQGEFGNYSSSGEAAGQKVHQKSSRRSYQSQRAERLDARENRQRHLKDTPRGEVLDLEESEDVDETAATSARLYSGDRTESELEARGGGRVKSGTNPRKVQSMKDGNNQGPGKFGKSSRKGNIPDLDSGENSKGGFSGVRGGVSRGGVSDTRGRRDSHNEKTGCEDDKDFESDPRQPYKRDRGRRYPNRGRGYKDDRGHRDQYSNSQIPLDDTAKKGTEKTNDVRRKMPVSDDVRISGMSGRRSSDSGSRRTERSGTDRKNNSEGFKGRKFNLSGQKLTAEELETQRGSLIEQLCNNNYECMVCYDVVYREAPVWSCKGCYHIYHLGCIRKWAASPAAVVEGEGGGWRCPACQKISHKFPGQYWCFCGKIREPLYNRYETPHSCGEMCGKKRDENCPHPCNILCHPGPCPSCNANVVKECDCKRSKQTVKCSQSSSLKCDIVCDKPLNCGSHNCSRVCHTGNCSSCEVEINQTCHCGQNDRVVFCGTEEGLYSSYSCEQVCNKILSCENHRCEKICHDGPCDVCRLHPDVVTHCPCGKTELSGMSEVDKRSSCLDPIPTCGQTCGKELPCGPEAKRHVCKRPCHEGECNACDGEMPVTCRCGFFIKEVPCVEGVLFTADNPFLCDKRCSKKRHCGRHKCNQLCCVDKEHKCEQICGRKLTCGLHRCDEPCHRGNCHTCWEVSFEELHCHCGTESIFPPIPCGTRPPQCHQLCRRQHPCEHPVRHNCHSDESCTPCTVLTQKWCLGGHELRNNIPCHITEVSCGLPCNRALPCGQHKCRRTCHKGPCLEKEGEKCTQKCTVRREECGHPCGALCHVGTPCPSTACKTEIDLKCPCGNRKERALCNLGGTSDKESAQEYPKMSSSMLVNRIFGSQSINIMNLTKNMQRQLECEEECHRIERNKRLAVALQIANPELSSKAGTPTYSQFLKDFAKLNPAFVANVEKALSDLVQNAKESKQSCRSHSFKPMKQQQRRVIHELAEFYGCKTQSYDYEPNKSVVATAYKDKCWLPMATLTKVVQREMHPLAPRPIPLNSTEKEVRAAARASSKQSLDYLSSSVSQDDITKTKRVERPFIDYFEMTD